MGGIYPKLLIHSSTKLTDFQCVIGYQPALFPWSDSITEAPAVDEWFRRSEEVWEQTHQHMEIAARLMTEFEDKQRGETPCCKVGGRVWLAIQYHWTGSGLRKHSPKYLTNQQNLLRTSPLHHSCIHPTFHVSSY